MATVRSGAFNIDQLDAAVYAAFFGAPRRERGEVRISSSEPVPCPSPWRHPIRWLHWNPFSRRKITLVMPDCEIHDNGDGTVTLQAHVAEPEPFPGFEFEQE